LSGLFLCVIVNPFRYHCYPSILVIASLPAGLSAAGGRKAQRGNLKESLRTSQTTAGKTKQSL